MLEKENRNLKMRWDFAFIPSEVIVIALGFNLAICHVWFCLTQISLIELWLSSEYNLKGAVER